MKEQQSPESLEFYKTHNLCYVTDQSTHEGYLGTKFSFENGTQFKTSHYRVTSHNGIVEYGYSIEHYDINYTTLEKLRQIISVRKWLYSLYPKDEEVKAINRMVHVFNARSKNFKFKKQQHIILG